ncbi:MAG: leucine-rich repeat protein [Clostridiales bacterium]|nr:leucine-rich repeat protein [Clostridiales bacterium]
MKNYTKKLVIMLLVVSIVTSVMVFAACNNSANGTYYYWNYNRLDKTQYFTLKNGKWTNEAGESGDYELNGASITLYIDFFGSREEYFSGTVKDGVLTLTGLGTMYFYKEGKQPQNGTTNPNNPGGQLTTKNKYTITYDANGGSFADSNTFTQQVEEGSKLIAPTSPTRKNYSFAGWAKKKNGSEMWKFDEETITEDTTLYAQWSQESAVILSVDGASMDGTDIYMFVTHDVESVSLSNKVICSDDSVWKLYYDRMGQIEIPTKVAANMSGYLASGENQFYIVVTSQNGAQVNLYELTVYRSYQVNVNYYDGTTLLNTETTYTGLQFTTNYRPSITGYTFNGWKDSNGKAFTSDTLWGTIALYADKTANTYTANLNVNGGDDLTQTTQTMTYDKSYSFPVPTRTGYSFTGWYVGNTQITNNSGRSLVDWNYASATTVTAHWQANEYKLTLATNNSSAGTVTGDGTYAYDSKVTISASDYSGYTFAGWYDDDIKLTEMRSYTFTMGLDYTICAHWNVVEEMQNFIFTSTASKCIIIGIYDKTMTQVVVPDYVTEIREGAFSGCNKIESITLPFVGSMVESDTDSLQFPFGFIFGPVNYEGGVATEQHYIWSIYNGKTTYNTSTCFVPGSLKNVTIKGGNILFGAFQNCSGITNIVLPSNVTSIGPCAFDGCSSWSITIPTTVTSIGSSAFRGCSKLTDITIPAGVTYIGYMAFYLCENLTNVTFMNPNGWNCYSSSGTLIKSLSSSDLNNTQTAAKYLTDTYSWDDWKRS